MIHVYIYINANFRIQILVNCLPYIIPEALGHALLHKMHLEIPNAAVLVGCWSNEQIIWLSQDVLGILLIMLQTLEIVEMSFEPK